MTNEQRKRIVQTWISRAEAQQLGKPTSAKYLAAQAHFVAGALAALNDTNPGLVISVMSGRSIADLLNVEMKDAD